jgi:thiol-disulfide isomerase/thioredoxin
MTANQRSRLSILFLLSLLPLLAISAALLMLISSGGANSGIPPTPLPVTQAVSRLAGRAAPNFELVSLDGGSIRLSSMRGRIVFLNFWATWCEPCKREMPAFQRFMQEQAGDKAVILAVNIGDKPEDIQKFLDDNGVSGIPVLLDTEYRAQTAYSANLFPTTFVIDPAGIVRDMHVGEMKLNDLTGYVDQIRSSSLNFGI